VVIASADHWNLKLRIRNAANGVPFARVNRISGGTAAGSEMRFLDLSVLELSDPSATIEL
tara:strand:+ start:188 stop:367 length:180 start_codon:yes stop_codon:yes gene_type:complete